MRARSLAKSLLWLVVALCAACGESRQPPSDAASDASSRGPAAPFPRTIRDAAGEAVTLPAPPQRIVSQTLGSDEILFAICPRSRIAGVSVFAANPAYSNIVDAVQASGLPSIDTGEDVLRLKPDLVFIATYSRAEVVELLRASRAPVFRFSQFDRIDDVRRNVGIVGQTIGEDAAAARLVADMDERLARVRARTAVRGGARPRIMSYDGLGYTAGKDTLFDDVIRAAGGVNVSAEQGASGFMRVSGEQVLAWDPDYLVCGAKSGEEAIVRRRLMAMPAIARSRAGRTGRILLMDTRLFLTVSHHVVSAVEWVADATSSSKPASAGSARE